MSRPSTPITAATARGTQTIDLEPLLASVRFRGEAITRLDVEVVRLLVSPVDPFAGWEIRRSLLEAVHGSSPAPADADVVPLGAIGGHAVEAVRWDSGWTVRLSTPR